MPKLPIGDIGPCEVVWDADGTPLNLSPFKGEVKLKKEDAIAKVFEEAYGEAPVDGVQMGSAMEFEVPMTRSTLDQLEKMIGGTLTGTSLTIVNKVGGAMYENAKAILIKPVVNLAASAVDTTWTRLWKCHPYGSWELTWSKENQRIFLVKFLVFPNQDSGYEGEFGTVGEPA